jgi:cell wall-associated NlpC family hydrolase
MKNFLVVLLLLLVVACSSSGPPRQSSGGGDDLIPYAKSLLGSPYHYGGDTPRTGFDCSGFVRHVFHHTRGVELPHNALGISRFGQRIKANQMQPGDLVFYSTQGSPFSHVGIYLGNARFIHAPSSGKKVEIVDMSLDYWREHYNGARRIDGKQYR